MLDASVEIHLAGFSLSAELQSNGKAVAVIGASGAGKSLLLKCLSGLATPARGSVWIDGRAVFDSASGVNLPPKDRRVGHVFQNYALFPHMSVRENVEFGIKGQPQASARARQWLEELEVGELEARYPRELSGGQAQRVALARALVTEPRLLLLDEPLSALDTHLKSRVEQRLAAAVRKFSGATVMVTHNLEEAFRICEDLVVLDQGRVIAKGEKHAVLKDPGTVAAAVLTGCKNVASASAQEGGSVTVPSWGVTFESLRDTPGNFSSVGIRAHHMRVRPSSQGDAAGPDTFRCRLVDASETPHRMTLFLKTEQAPVDASPLQVEVLKDRWDELRMTPEPWHLTIPADRLLRLRDPS